MITKFLLMLGLLPVIASFLARKFLCDRIVKREGGGEVSLTGAEFADRILKRAGASPVDISVKARPFLRLGPGELVLPPSVASSRTVREVAEAGLLAGMVLMAQRQKKVVAWRTWALKFSWAGPVFASVVMIFASVVGRVSPSLSIAIIIGMLGMTTILLWTTLAVERAAARVVADLLTETAIVNRRSEAEQLTALVKALGWRRIIPGAIAWIGK